MLGSTTTPSILPAWHDAPNHVDAAASLAGRLKQTRAAVKVWVRCNRAPPEIIPNCKFLIQLLDFFEEHRSLSADESQVRRVCQDGLTWAIRQRAAYWKQRGKHRAVREGDANTSFFHAHATQRLRRNQIRSIEVAGVPVSSHQDKIVVITEHFKSIMGTAGECNWGFDLDTIYQGRPRATSAQDVAFSAEEALRAVRDMNSSSAPGPDGFGPSFYRAAWSTVQPQIMEFLSAFYHGTADLERINCSYMVLLPKKQGATAVSDFRPICMQNCSVKIAAKALTSRLQKEIVTLIDLDQTGFIKGRTISENFVFAAELVQTCYKRKVPTLVLKLDFAKAFDTVNWSSLMTLLAARGFSDIWRGWIHRILSTSLTAVLVNGCPGPWFACQRGLRQGDPMSPYLFLLVADVLQTLIKQDGVRHPLVSDTPCPVLQYADDTLILLRGDVVDVCRLKLLLDQFSDATGLLINYNKSTMVPMNMTEVLTDSCRTILGCRQEGFPQTYLGLPLSCSKLTVGV